MQLRAEIERERTQASATSAAALDRSQLQSRISVLEERERLEAKAAAMAEEHTAQMLSLSLAAAANTALADERLRQAAVLAQHNNQQQALHSSFTLHSMAAAGVAQAPAAADSYMSGAHHMYHDPAGPWRPLPPPPRRPPPQRPPPQRRRRDRQFRSRSRSRSPDRERGRLGRPAALWDDDFAGLYNLPFR